MAEQVHLHQEASLDELAHLLEQGVFSEKRIKAIVSTREKFEYRLKRRGVLKEDYIKYIEYEKQLCMEIRAATLNTQHSSKHGHPRRVLALYQRAIVKFSHDARLWGEFLEYSSVHATRLSFAKSVNRALKLHPRCHKFWILAAEWEWNSHGNMHGARRLLQRGIQINHAEPNIYLALFKLEISFCEKVLERRTILGADSALEDGHVLEGELASIVLQSAVEVGGITAREAAEYLVCARKAGSFLPKLLPKVVSHISELLLKGTVDIGSLGKCLITQPSTSVGVQLILTLLDQLNDVLDANTIIASVTAFLEISRLDVAEEVVQMVRTKLDQFLRLAEDKGLVTSECYLLWLNASGFVGYDDKQVQELTERALRANPEDQRLQFQSGLLRIQLNHTSYKLSEMLKLIESLEDPHSKEKLFSLFLGKCQESEVPNPQRVRAFIEKILTNPRFPINDCPSITFERIFSLLGADHFRELYDKLARSRGVSPSLYEAWINIETNQGRDLTTCRSIITKARVLFPSHAGILRAAYNFEKSLRNFTQAAKYAECASLCGVQI